MLPPRDWPKYGELAPRERAPGVTGPLLCMDSFEFIAPGEGVAGLYCWWNWPWLHRIETNMFEKNKKILKFFWFILEKKMR